jgi:hypothetical protein
VKVNDNKYKPKQLDVVVTDSAAYRVLHRGLGNHDLLKRSKKGKINVFLGTTWALAPNLPNSILNMANAGPNFTNVKLEYMSRGLTGKLMKIKYKSLSSILGQDSPGSPLLAKYRKMGYTKWGLILGGIAVLGIGGTLFEDQRDIMITSGLVISLSSIYVHVKRKPLLREALHAHNGN